MGIFLFIVWVWLCVIYNYHIDYDSTKSLQILWEEIRKLGKELDINDIDELKNVLPVETKKEFENMIYEYGIGYQPKDCFIVQTENFLKTEIEIIAALKNKITEGNKPNEADKNKPKETENKVGRNRNNGWKRNKRECILKTLLNAIFP